MRREKKQKETFYKELGKYFLDMSKLVFSGIILTGIMGMEIDIIALLILGSIVVSIFGYAGFVFLKLSKTKKKRI